MDSLRTALKMPVMPGRYTPPVHMIQADRDAGDPALQVGASRGEVTQKPSIFSAAYKLNRAKTKAAMSTVSAIATIVRKILFMPSKRSEFNFGSSAGWKPSKLADGVRR